MGNVALGPGCHSTDGKSLYPTKATGERLGSADPKEKKMKDLELVYYGGAITLLVWFLQSLIRL
jgi:hypothetical protein